MVGRDEDGTGARAVVPQSHLYTELSMTAATPVRLTKNLGMLLLGIWLIISGLIPLLKLSFEGLGTLLAVLALAAGALILAGR
jgi:hypothetical protein